jgi:hypothetical protein
MFSKNLSRIFPRHSWIELWCYITGIVCLFTEFIVAFPSHVEGGEIILFDKGPEIQDSGFQHLASFGEISADAWWSSRHPGVDILQLSFDGFPKVDASGLPKFALCDNIIDDKFYQICEGCYYDANDYCINKTMIHILMSLLIGFFIYIVIDLIEHSLGRMLIRLPFRPIAGTDPTSFISDRSRPVSTHRPGECRFPLS